MQFSCHRYSRPDTHLHNAKQFGNNGPEVKANGYNWVAYQHRMELTMDVLKLKDHLTNAEMPESYASAETIDGVTPAIRWDRDDATAKQYIAASLPESTFIRISKESRAKDVWDKLQETFGNKHRIGLAVALLERRLFNKRCGDDEDVRSHFEKLLDLREELAGLGRLFSDNEFSYILITSFPTSYTGNACISTLEVVAELTRNDLDPFNVFRAITGFYDRRVLRNSESTTSQQRSSSTTRRKTGRGH